MKILLAVQKYLISHFSKIEVSMIGGIYIRPKPANRRLDLIELNYLPVEHPEAKKNRGGFVNVNYQDTDFERVEEYTKYLDDVLTGSVIGEHYYQSELQQIGRISPYLWMGNNMYKLTNI